MTPRRTPPPPTRSVSTFTPLVFPSLAPPRCRGECVLFCSVCLCLWLGGSRGGGGQPLVVVVVTERCGGLGGRVSGLTAAPRLPYCPSALPESCRALASPPQRSLPSFYI
ncbi:unnamed protein product [Gadus morhua 'NCC']